MRQRILLVVAALVALLAIGGCGGEGKSSDPLGTDSLAFGDSSGSVVLALDLNGAVQLTAKVKDAAGKEVKDREVFFDIFPNASGATLSSTKATTNAAGEATLLYRAGGLPGFDVVRAFISNGTRVDVNITVGGGMGGTQVALAAAPTSLAAGQSSIVTATVTNASGTPVRGQPVTFAFAANNSGATLTTLSGTTDVSGKAIAQYRAGTNSPTLTVQDTVVAAVTGSTAAVVITRTVGTAAGFQMDVTATNTRPSAGDASVITATVRNADGTAAAGQLVTFAFVDGFAPSGASLVPINSGITDVSGRALAIYTAGPFSPSQTVQDVVLARASGTAAAVVITRVAASVTGNRISSLTAIPSTLSIATGGTSIVTATIVGGVGVTPVPGVAVTFQVLAGVGSFVVATATSGNDGRANGVFSAPAGAALNSQSVIRATIAGSDAVVIITWGP